MLRKLLFLLVFLFGLSFMLTSSAHAAVTWSETRPAGDQNRAWSTSSLSSDGNKMIVGNQDGGLFLSSNAGNSWTQISPSGYETDVWYISAMSDNGQVILAGVYGGRIYISHNGGDSWSETQPLGNSNAVWNTASMSSDGQIIFVSTENDRLYRTMNGGSSWSEVQPIGDQDRNWLTGLSGDGRTILASEDDGSGGRLYLSTNTGNTWNEVRPAGNSDYGWTTVSMSADGKVMLAAIASSRIYLSRDGGNTWTEAGEESLTGQWIRASLSPEGQTIVVSSTQRLFFSSDTGSTWSQTQPAGDQDKSWQNLSLSRNSRVLLAGSYDGRIYIGSNPPLPVPEKSSSPQCVLIPTGPDLFQINTAKATSTLYFVPVGNASNYIISYGTTSDANQFSVRTNLGSSTGVLSYTINDLPVQTVLYFKVYAQNDCTRGGWGNSMAVKTDGKVYYKNLISRVLSVLPKQTTSLSEQSTLGVTSCSTYTVQPGDSLWGISSSNLGSGTKYQSIMQSNGLNSSHLTVGQKLKVGC